MDARSSRKFVTRRARTPTYPARRSKEAGRRGDKLFNLSLVAYRLSCHVPHSNQSLHLLRIASLPFTATPLSPMATPHWPNSHLQ
jgi:hypothetical protein